MEDIKAVFDAYKVESDVELEAAKKASFTDGFNKAGDDYETQMGIMGEFAFKKGWMMAHRKFQQGTDESALATVSDLKTFPTPALIALPTEDPNTLEPYMENLDGDGEDDVIEGE